MFSANAGIVLKNTAIVASFGAEPRRHESDHWLKYFQSKGFDVIDPREDDIMLEGCGDFMSLQVRLLSIYLWDNLVYCSACMAQICNRICLAFILSFVMYEKYHKKGGLQKFK